MPNRIQIRMLKSEHPQGHPTRGAPYGERLDPGTLVMAQTFGSILGGLGAAKSLFGGSGGGATATPPPTVTPPTVMPIPDDQAAADSKRRALAGLSARRGRQSTILSDPASASSDLLG